MHVLIIGASKGIGLETTLQALDAGHKVRAFARSAATIGLSNSQLEKVRGDALKAQDVAAALIGIDVVIQTLGVGLSDLFRPIHLFSDATRVLVPAMKDRGVKRLICVTGFGAGDSRASISWIQTTNPVNAQTSILVDYNLTLPQSPGPGNSFSGALWDVAIWDQAVWSGALAPQTVWVDAQGLGTAISVCYQLTTALGSITPDVRIASFDVLFEAGSIGIG